jgi:hypothetical protein
MRGQNEVVAVDRMRIAGVHGLLGHMLDGVASGSFVPTDSAADCKICNFAAVCRARDADYPDMESPLAAWSEQHTHTAVWPAFASLKRVRTYES